MPKSRTDASFFAMTEVIGHGRELNTPLQTYLGEQGTSRLPRAYADWIHKSGLSSRICFLDITFSRVENPGDILTLVFAPDEDRYTIYTEALSQYISSGHTMAPHQVFQRGLPSFRRGEETVRPKTSEQLAECFGDSTLHLVDEGILLWKRKDVTKRRKLAEQDVPKFSGQVYQISKDYERQGGQDFFKEVSCKPITVAWDKWIEKLTSEAHRLTNPRGENLSLLVAAPLGFYSTPTDVEFTQVASVFFGLGGTANKEVAFRLLRWVSLHLYLANASFMGTQLQQAEEFDFAQHEIKHVINGIRPDSPPVVLISIRQYFNTLFGIAGDQVSDLREQKALPEEFLQGNTLREFVRNAAKAAARIECVVLMCADAEIPQNKGEAERGIDAFITEVLDQFDDSDFGRDIQIPASRNSKQTEHLWQFFNALTAGLRNIIKHGFIPGQSCDQKISARREPGHGDLLLKNYKKKDDEQKSERRFGTLRVLRYCVREYGGAVERVTIRVLPSEDPSKEVWGTTIPLPPVLDEKRPENDRSVEQ